MKNWKRGCEFSPGFSIESEAAEPRSDALAEAELCVHTTQRRAEDKPAPNLCSRCD